MKLNFTCLIGIIVLFASSCVSNDKTAVLPIPDGTFSGQFRLLHIHSDKTIDTTKTNITLYLSPSPALTYTVTGDTATVHAGSLGTFYASSANSTIIFNDKTYPKSGIPTKTHLSGAYQYLLKDNTNLQMVAYGPLDTLVLQYDLKRVN